MPISSSTQSMQTRLLAFLAETERAVRVGKPEPLPGSQWEAARSVNYGLGLARLSLGARSISGEHVAHLLLQSFKLADGTVCLKANLAWTEAGAELSHPIYSKPSLDWGAEALRLAAVWLSGPTAKPLPISETPELLAAG